MSAIIRCQFMLILIVFSDITSHANEESSALNIAPLWDDTFGNYSDFCSLQWNGEINAATFYGNSLYLCSLRVSTTSAGVSVQTSGDPNEDFLLYIERSGTLGDCQRKVSAILGHRDELCSTSISFTDGVFNLYGNVSINITVLTDQYVGLSCPSDDQCSSCTNLTMPNCEVRNYDDVITCDGLDGTTCKLSFPPSCNATILYREVYLNCNGSYNKMHESKFMAFSNHILTLDITNTNAVEIKPGAFRNLFLLENLQLGLNKIQIVPLGVFDGLVRLVHLSLKHNLLVTLEPGLFKDSSMLSVLDISDNGLVTLPPGTFHNLSGLNELLLSDNKLTSIHENLFTGLINLETIDFSRNKISLLPASLFRGLFRLQKLFLSENQIERLDDVTIFQNLTNLIRLYLVDNQLRTLDGDIFQGLRSLKYLRLSGNQFRSFGSDLFKHVTHGSSIHLQRNLLETIKGGLFVTMSKIHSINLSENKLKTLPSDLLESIPHLDILNLRGNALRYLPVDVFKGIIELKVLYLDSNTLTDLQNNLLIDQGNLTKFVVQGNDLETIGYDIFTNTRKLNHLDLSNNKLESLPNLEGLDKLSFVELTGNSLRNVKKETFGKAPAGMNLFVSQHEICECYTPGTINCSASSNRSPFLTCDRLLSDRVLVAMMWLIGLNALGGNAFVLWHKSKNNKNRAQSFLYNNLAFSDLLMGVYMIWIAIADIYFGEAFPLRAEDWRTGITCRVAGALSIIASEGSVFFITLISIDRFMSVKYPQSYFKLRSQWSKLVIASMWSFAALLGIVPSILAGKHPNFYDNSHVCIGLPLALYETYTKTNVKNVAGGHQQVFIEFSKWLPTGHRVGMYYSVAVFLGLNCVCYFVIVSCYVAIIRTVYVSSKRAGLNSEMKTQIRLTLKVAAIVITDFICWFPIILLGILVQAKVLTLPPSVFAWSVTFVLPINSAINPYLYTIADVISSRRKEWLERSRTSRTQISPSRRSRVNSRQPDFGNNRSTIVVGYDNGSFNNDEKSQVEILTCFTPVGTDTVPLPNVPENNQYVNSNV